MAYTFKDDGGTMTYYREYNKEVLDKNDTLVGNWVEERALRDQIGTGRYALWVNTGDEKSVATNKQKTFTKFNTRPDAHDTFERTLAHSDHTPSAEYCTNNDVRDPGYARYVNPGVGAREKLLVQRAAALAKDEEDGTIGELPSNYQSTHRQDFGQLELPPAESLGRKVMMTQNMIDIKGAGDGLWRKEAGLTAKNLFIEGEGGGFNQTMTATGIKPKFGFGKVSDFSTPIEHAIHGTVQGGGNGNEVALGNLQNRKGPTGQGGFLYDSTKPAP